MIRRWLVVAAIWSFGFACGLLYVAVSGGWYEYEIVSGVDIRSLSGPGWELVTQRTADSPFYGVRRPRFRLGG